METHYQGSAKARDTTECQAQCSNFWKWGWFHYRETNHPSEQKPPKLGGKRTRKLQISVNYILSAPRMPGGVMNLEISTRVTSQYLTPYVPKTHYSSGNESIGRQKQTNTQRINYLQEEKLSLFSWFFPIASKLIEKDKSYLLNCLLNSNYLWSGIERILMPLWTGLKNTDSPNLNPFFSF